MAIAKDYKNFGTHVGHCCLRHGCKYGDDCPVEDGVAIQDHPCEYCRDQREIIDPILEDLAQVYFNQGYPEIDDIRRVLEKHL